MNEKRKQAEESSIKPTSHEFSSLQTIHPGSMDHVWGATLPWHRCMAAVAAHLDHGLGQTCRSLWPTWQVELFVGLSWEWRVGLEGPACCQLCAFSTLMIYLVSPFGVQVQHSKLLLYHAYAESCITPPACSSPEGQIISQVVLRIQTSLVFKTTRC